MNNSRKRTRRSQRGAALVEYALLLSTITLLALPAVRALSVGINRNFCNVMAEGQGQFDPNAAEGERCKGPDSTGTIVPYF